MSHDRDRGEEARLNGEIKRSGKIFLLHFRYNLFSRFHCLEKQVDHYFFKSR